MNYNCLIFVFDAKYLRVGKDARRFTMKKHVGLFNAQKVTIILNKMPNEDHMALVVMDDKLPPRYYQALKAALDTPEGQEAKEFATALENVFLEDHRNLGFVLHSEGHLKKVPSNQVFATPFGYESSNKIRLNELNEYLTKIENGGDALKKLEDFEENKGLNRKTKSATARATAPPVAEAVEQRGSPSYRVKQPIPHFDKVEDLRKETHKFAVEPQIASADLRAQGENLRAVASQLLEQAKLLAKKADQLYPSLLQRGPGRPKGTGLKKLQTK